MNEQEIMAELNRLVSRIVTGSLGGRMRREIARGVQPRVKQALRRDPRLERNAVGFHCFVDSDGQVLWNHAQREVTIRSFLRQLSRLRVAPQESLAVGGTIGGRRRRGGPLPIRVTARRSTPSDLSIRGGSNEEEGRREGGRARARTPDPERLQRFLRHMERARSRDQTGEVRSRGGGGGRMDEEEEMAQ